MKMISVLRLSADLGLNATSRVLKQSSPGPRGGSVWALVRAAANPGQVLGPAPGLNAEDEPGACSRGGQQWDGGKR